MKKEKNNKINFILETFTEYEKLEISKKIKNITICDIKNEMNQLFLIGNNASSMSSRSRIGNNIVDYFTFKERLNTKGKYNISFYDFIVNIDVFTQKKFIKNMLTYYTDVKNKNKTKNEYIVLKEVYNICISAINIFRPLVAMEIYSRFKPTSILDFCAGWGGRLVAACALNINTYIGIDINSNLEINYIEMSKFLSDTSKTKIQMYFQNAVNFDYSKINYDMVLTSPPYYFLEKYSNNENFLSKKEMNDKFYIPIVTNSYKYMQKGGHYCLNINKEIYENVCIDILGNANEMIPLKKSKRQNDYNEYIYVWIKI